MDPTKIELFSSDTVALSCYGLESFKLHVTHQEQVFHLSFIFQYKEKKNINKVRGYVKQYNLFSVVEGSFMFVPSIIIPWILLASFILNFNQQNLYHSSPTLENQKNNEFSDVLASPKTCRRGHLETKFLQVLTSVPVSARLYSGNVLGPCTRWVGRHNIKAYRKASNWEINIIEYLVAHYLSF